jgi:hypothetical protein
LILIHTASHFDYATFSLTLAPPLIRHWCRLFLSHWFSLRYAFTLLLLPPPHCRWLMSLAILPH